MKICKVCLKEKNLEQFYNRGDRKYAKRSMCISCHSDRRRKRYTDATVNEEFKKEHAKQSSEWRKENPEKAMLTRAKSRAINKNLEFDLILEDVVIPDLCPILGIKLEKANGIASDNSPSIDRLDSSKGYTKNNIIVCSYRANRIKSDSSFEDIEKLYNWYKKMEKQC
jgi:hypothetical protein